MFWLLARRTKTCSTFQLQVCIEAGRENSRTAPRLTPKLAKELFSTITVMLDRQLEMAFPIFSLFFQDQLFGTIVFECKAQSRSLLFQDQLHRTDAHDRCSGVDWVSVFQVGDGLHCISLTLYILLLL